MNKNISDSFSNYSFLLEKTGKKIKQYAKQQFREYGFGVTIDQWALLKVLHEQSPMSQVDLAQECHKDTPTVTRILDLLVQKELVERQTDEIDRRKVKVELTSKGNTLILEMLPKVKEIRMHAWQHLNEDDFRNFVRILNTIYDNLDE